jgi:predicted dehydrogenase
VSPNLKADGSARAREAVLAQLMRIAAACDLTIPSEHRRSLGIIGAGAIVDVAHLPAYRKAGLEVVAIVDRDLDRASAVAARHGVTRVHMTIDDLLDDEDVALVDIAVPAPLQPEIAIRAMEAGKDVMCQKPLAIDLVAARQIVDRAAQLGRKVAVQQQLRFEEGIAATRAMIGEGWIGEPTAVSFTVDVQTDFSAWSWLVEAPKLELYYHSIHYFDAIRALIGEPARVFGTQSRRPGQVPRGETRTISTLVYPGDLRAVVHANHENLSGQNRAEFQVDGTAGTIRGTLGLLYDYPHGRPDTLAIWSNVVPTDGWLSYPVTTRWIPDAFIGPVRSLLAAIATEGEPETSARDNLGTLRIIEALYRSGETGESQAIRPEQATTT